MLSKKYFITPILFLVLGFIISSFVLFPSQSFADWTKQTNNVENLNFVYITQSPNGDTFIATSWINGYTYISTDNGASWIQQTDLGPFRMGYYAYSPDGNTLIATRGNGSYTYISTDNGTSWIQQIDIGALALQDYTYSPDGNTLIATSAVNYYTYISTDNGTSWIQKTDTEGLRFSDYTYSPDGNILIATSAVNYYTYISTDNGTSWIQQTDLGALNLQHYIYSPDGNNLIAVSNNDGYTYISTDNGTSWIKQIDIGELYLRYYTYSSNGDTLVATSSNNCIYISTNNGIFWTQQECILVYYYTYSPNYDTLIAIDINGNLYTYTFSADLTAYNEALGLVTEVDYTAISWSSYQIIVNDNIVTESNTQEEVDAATLAITNAQENLVLKPDLTSPTFGPHIGTTGGTGVTTIIGVTVNDNRFVSRAEISFDDGATYIPMTETEASITRDQDTQRRYTYDKVIPQDQSTNIDYIIKAYDSNNNFSTLEDTIIVSIFAISNYSSTPDEQLLIPNDEVHSSVIASDGTIYIGGDFTMVGEEERSGIASFNIDGTLTNFAPSVDGIVYSLALSEDENILYIGGLFTTINEESRNSLASINLTTGILTSFDPNLSASNGNGGRVSQLIVSPDGNTLYASGGFSKINVETTRSHLASWDIADPENVTLKTFDAGIIDGGVPAIVLSSDESILYLGGGFTSVNGTARNYMASVYTEDGALTDFDPIIDNYITSILLSPDDETLYTIGWFTSVNDGNDIRNSFASFNTSDGTLTDLDLNIDTAGWVADHLIAISPEGTELFIGGYFETVGETSETRNSLASWRLSDEVLTNFNPNMGENYCDNCDSYVNTVIFSPDGSKLYIGGGFTSVGGDEDQQYFTSFSRINDPEEEPVTPTRHHSRVVGSSRAAIAQFQNTQSNNVIQQILTQSNPTITILNIKRILKLNIVGDDVKELQVWLNNHGYPVSLTGPGSKGSETNFFGPKTKLAVIAFQKANGLVADGIVGPKTIEKMK